MGEVIVVRFDGDSRGAVRAANDVRGGIVRVGDSGRRTTPVLRTLAKVAAVGVAAAFTVLAGVVKVGFDELSEGQKVAAQTRAVLESTGAVANVTANDVAGLAGELSRMSGVDDELIQKGENLLLTFKNVRNEVGEGNKVFDRATTSALDLSVAGFGSLESTSKMLGKALNDPVKGMTALGRAGVTFSEEQKKAIKAMTESGDLLGAQKLILAEVESQVRGSAKAYGETLPGQLSKLRNSFEEVAATVATALLPHLIAVLDWVNVHMPEIQAVITTAIEVVSAVVERAASVFRDHLQPAIEGTIAVVAEIVGWLREHETTATILLSVLAALGTAILAWNAYVVISTALSKAWAAAQLLLNAVMTANPIGLVIIAIAALVAGFIIAYQRSETFRAIVQAALNGVRVAAQALASFFTGTVMPALTRVWDVASRAVSEWWNFVRPIVSAVIQIIRGMVDIVVGILTGDWGRAWDGLKTAALGGWNLFKAWVLALPRLVFGWALEIGRAIADGIKDGFIAAFEGVKDSLTSKVRELADSLKRGLRIRSPSEVTADEIGKPMAEGIRVGFIDGSRDLPTTMSDKVREAIEAARAAVEERRGVFAQAFSLLSSEALAAFDKVASEIETRTERKLRLMDEAARKRELKENIAEARADVQAAIGEGLSLTQGEGESAEDFAARQREAGEKIKAAQRELADALAAQRRADLERQAAEERKALDNRTALRRRHFEEDLAALQRYAERHGLSAEEMNRRLLKIFEKYGVPFKEATRQLGGALAEGLREAAGEVAGAAEQLRREIVSRLSNLRFNVTVDVKVTGDRPPGRQHGGPVDPGMAYWVGEAGKELLVMGSRGGYVIPNHALRAGAAAAATPAGGMLSLTVNVNAGSIIGATSRYDLAQQLARLIAPEIGRVAMYENRI